MNEIDIEEADAVLLGSRMHDAVGVYRAAFGSAPHCENWQAPSVSEELHNYVSAGVLLFASLGTRVVGLAASLPGPRSSYFELASPHLTKPDRSIDIAELCVIESYRGQGIAGNLLDNLLGRAPHCEVFLRVALEATIAKSMYESRAFVELAGTREMYEFPRVPGCRPDDSEEDERVLLMRTPHFQ
jgi:ribosomal protein S18 acetylase RimI-like enzyme